MRKAPHVLKKTAAQTELTVEKKKKRKVACCFPSGWELCFPTPEWLLEFSFQPYPHHLPTKWKRTATGTASQRLWAGLYVSSTTRRRTGIDLPLWCLPNTRPVLVVMVTRAVLVQVSYCDRTRVTQMMRGMKEDRPRGSSSRAPETVVLRAVVRGLRRLRKYKNPSQVLCREAPTSTHPTWLSPAGSLRRHVWRYRLQTCHCWLEKVPSQPQERHICCSNIAFTFLPTLRSAEKARSDLGGRTEFALSFSMNQSEVARNGKTTPQNQACFWVRVCMCVCGVVLLERQFLVSQVLEVIIPAGSWGGLEE